MRARDYKQAFMQLLTESKLPIDTLIKQFVDTVIANGHRAYLPKLERMIEKAIKEKQKQETIVVTSAKEMDEKDVAQLLKDEPFRNVLGSRHRKVVRAVDTELIGGHIIRTSSRRIDTSYRKALIELYEQITK